MVFVLAAETDDEHVIVQRLVLEDDPDKLFSSSKLLSLQQSIADAALHSGLKKSPANRKIAKESSKPLEICEENR